MPKYPDTRRGQVVDDYHGTEIADPYRWLEDAESDETRAWITAQNAVTEAELARIPLRAALRDRVAELWDHPRRGVPWFRGGRWFQLRNDGMQNQDVLWTAAGPAVRPPDDDAWSVLLDPNGWSEDGTASLMAMAATDDGRLLAHARSAAGSDWMTWRVVDTTTGDDLGDEVPWSKFSGAAWLPDGSGFLYGAYQPPAQAETYAATNRDQQLRLHRLGTPASDDTVVYVRPDQPEWGFDPTVTQDGRWLVLTVWEGTQPYNRIHVAPLSTDAGATTIGEIRPLLDEGDAEYASLGALGDRLLFLTDRDAPLGRIVSVDPTEPSGRGMTEADLDEVVPEGHDRLERARIVGAHDPGDPGWIVAAYLHHARHVVRVHDTSGRHLHDVDLPTLGSVPSIGGSRHEQAITVTFETFEEPPQVRRHDLTGTEPDEVLHQPVLPAVSAAGAADLVTEQVFVHHEDGIKVPVFLVHRRDVAPTGGIPTILYGYGGFDIAVTPTFKVAWRVWVERGGLLAVANLRGGGEYGRSWHDDGRLAKKQHVFDDAIAVAEWLAGESGWTSPEHLAIEGRSNGGLLVGACMTQRPSLFGACVPEVGVLDMLRFHRFTIGWGWVSDYGSADDPEQFEWLRAYSPLHRLHVGTCYPPTLVTTGDHDDRVVPAHSFKFAAALQHAQGCDNPTLVRIDTSAGHGAGKPTSKLIEERADVVAFEAHHTGLE